MHRYRGTIRYRVWGCPPSSAHPLGATGPRRAEAGPGKGRCRNCLKGGYPGRTWWNHREWPSLARFRWMQEAGVDGNIIWLEENEVTMWRQILAICAFIAGLQAVTFQQSGGLEDTRKVQCNTKRESQHWLKSEILARKWKRLPDEA